MMIKWIDFDIFLLKSKSLIDNLFHDFHKKRSDINMKNVLILYIMY
jgi:hypothetical protein